MGLTCLFMQLAFLLIVAYHLFGRRFVNKFVSSISSTHFFITKLQFALIFVMNSAAEGFPVSVIRLISIFTIESFVFLRILC